MSKENILIIGGSGYVGRYLKEKLTKEYRVDICDRSVADKKINIDYNIDYRNLAAKDIIKYDWILWFAGHSSVPVSINDPMGALYNNSIGLLELFQKVIPEKTKVIYASTGSLYSRVESLKVTSSETDDIYPDTNAYDVSKFAFDYLAPNYFQHFYGLRMGTVSGYSINMRKELIFNKMNIDAIESGLVSLANPSNMRSILFLSDLAAIIKIIIKDIPQFGFYNAASVSGSIEEIGGAIASYHRAEIKFMENSKSYSFALNCTKLEEIGYKPAFTLDEQIQRFTQEYKNANAS